MVWDRKHQVPDSEPVDQDEIVGVLRAGDGPRSRSLLEVGWKSRFHCDERQVAQYRHGRVFLAGDAAHVHSPMGGQGMNTGIQDAANLAWKIDAVLAGADDAVLDSYHDERHPIGKRVLLQSGLMARGVTLHPRIARGMRNLLAPRLLRVPRVRDAIAGSFAGTTLRYAHRRGDSSLVGTRATQIPLTQGRLTELQRVPGFVFVRECGATPVDAAGLLQAERADAWSGGAGATRRLHRLGRRLGRPVGVGRGPCPVDRANYGYRQSIPNYACRLAVIRLRGLLEHRPVRLILN